jgi:hypothetical protein
MLTSPALLRHSFRRQRPSGFRIWQRTSIDTARYLLNQLGDAAPDGGFLDLHERFREHKPVRRGEEVAHVTGLRLARGGNGHSP